MLPIRGRPAILFRLIAIPTAALLASHGVWYRRFPWEANYQFPLSSFLTVALIMLACWEANLWVFRRLDQTMPFYQHPLRRVGRQVLVGSLVTTLTFGVMLTVISLIQYGDWPSVQSAAIGLFICFTIASLVNGVYVGFYLIDAISWQKQQSTDELNARLTRPQPVVELPQRAGILIEAGNQTLQLLPTEIAYFYSSAGLVQLIRVDGRKITTSYDSLNELNGRLSPTRFFQINRQCIVSLDAVRAVRDDINRKLTVELAPGLVPGQATEQMSVSRYRNAGFRRWLQAAGTSTDKPV